MANPAPTINQINAFNATQGTTIDFNIIGGTELVRSNRIYIYDLSDNSLICTHLYVSTESIHELPPNTDGSIVYESGKSSADFVNGAQYYAQIQTFTDIAGTEGGSGLSVAKMFWCLVDPTLTIITIPSTISTTSYNVSATYNANTSVVSNIIQQYQFSLYSATGSLLQSSGVVVGSGEQQGTSTTYDISYNFTGLSVGSSYYVVVDVTTTQGMSVSAQSNTFTVSIDTPTLGEATVVNNACDGYISVTSNLSSEYGGSGSGEIVSFETDSENVFTKLQVDLEPVQDLHGYDKPWVGGAGKNLLNYDAWKNVGIQRGTAVWENNGVTLTATSNDCYTYYDAYNSVYIPASDGETIYITWELGDNAPQGSCYLFYCDANKSILGNKASYASSGHLIWTIPSGLNVGYIAFRLGCTNANTTISYKNVMIRKSGDDTWQPYENICPISGHDEVDAYVTGINVWDEEWEVGGIDFNTGVNNTLVDRIRSKNFIPVIPNATYFFNNGTNNAVVLEYDADKNYLGKYVYKNPNQPVETMLPNCHYIKFYMVAAYGTTYNHDISINYPSTDHDYHAYNGTTLHEDIEATYTPTVQENDVYLFKQTGDVGGDRETDMLVGGTVAWNQIVTFSQGSGTSNGITFTRNSGGTIVASGTATATAVHNLTRFNVTAGHKYLFDSGTNDSEAVITLTNSASWGGSAPIGISGIGNCVASGASSPSLVVYSGTTLTNKKFVPQVFDLTQLFGTTIADYIYSLEQATAGAGVAWFRKLFPKNYYAYNAGELMSVQASSHDMVGFNAWDEEWELGALSATGGNATSSTEIRSKNYIPVVGGQTYYLYCAVASTFNYKFYDADKNFISGSYISRNNTLTIPNDARYMRFYMGAAYGTTYKNDICINLSDPSRNGEYEPYEKHSYPLDNSLTLRGIPKLDANNNLYYDGDVYESSGKVTRKYGVVDLGTLTWTRNLSNEGYYRFYAQMPFKSKLDPYWVKNGICSKYRVTVNIGQDSNDKVIGSSGNNLYAVDNDYTDATAFKTSLNGVYYVAELATPTTETADAFEEIQKVTPIYGTEEFVDNRAVPMPVGNNTQYLTRDVYGGYIDFVNGLLVVDRAIIDLGTLNWTYDNTSYAYSFFTSTAIGTRKGGSLGDALCSQYTINQGGRYSLGSGTGQIASYNEGATTTSVCVRDDNYTDATAFKTAMNGVQLVCELAEPLTFQLTPQQIQTLVGVNNVWSEQGEISLAYHIPITNLLVKRQDVGDVSGSWLTLYSQPITQSSDMDFTFIDFTNQYGKTYKYALVPLLTQTQSGVEVEVEGGYTVSDEVQSVFDGVFIVDSTGSQKCKANVGYGNVDMNQSVGTITPIGAKYPVVITNSKNQYHNGSISGTIVPDDYYFNGNLSRIDMVNKRDELEQFLTNKRAKIIKDWNGKIWLVMIMDNVSCTFNNNYGMGIVNFNTNWVEVGDPTNQQDLQATGLINVGGV